MVNITSDNNNEIICFNLLYIQNERNFYVFKSFYNEYNQSFFYSMNISEICNLKIEIEELNNYNESINSSLFSKLSTTPLLPTTALEKTSNMPLSTTLEIKDELSSTILEIKNELFSTILETKDKLSSTELEIKD